MTLVHMLGNGESPSGVASIGRHATQTVLEWLDLRGLEATHREIGVDAHRTVIIPIVGKVTADG